MKQLSIALIGVGSICFAMPFFSADGPNDESAYRKYVVSAFPVEGPDHMYDPALEGGPTGTFGDATMNNVRPGATEIGVPSGGPPSPLFGAGSWEQKLLRFEEFGAREIEVSEAPVGALSVPTTPGDCPDDEEFDELLAGPLFPPPMVESNDLDTSPWSPLVSQYLGRPVDMPAEGRPPGQGWAHQRWDEFEPLEHYVTAQTGARTNTGFRDGLQNHGYRHTAQGLSEFGPFGLYHNTTGLTGFDGTTAGIEPKFHPNMPVQQPDSLWTFDGCFPPRLLMARVGVPVLMRHYNALPIDVTANRGFGMHTISTHEHNGHNPAESDGFAGAFFFPGQYYDYRWPMVIAGHDTINVNATDPRAGTPTDDGGIVNIPGDYREIMSTHWFHDHMLDFTAQNVYKGNAAMMNYYSSIDRGNEAINDGVNLRLPSGSSQGWGNRDYDVNLVIAGKAWDDQGQLWYNPFQTDGMLGDRMLTNWQYHPYLDVRARKYRFRLLNGSVARYIKLALVVEREGNVGQFNGPAGSGVSYDTVPFHMIANDGNLMEHAINFDGTSGTRRGELPTQAIGERYDIVVDFSQFERGTNLYFVNLMAHDNGRGPDDRIPLGQVLNGTYNPTEVDLDGDGRSDTYVGGDRCVERFLQLRVKPMYPWMQDLSTDLAAYEPGGLKLVEHNRPTAFELANAHQRHFKFGRSGGTDKAPWTVENSEGAFTADTRRVTSAPAIGDIEVWTIEGTNGWSHPVHIHFEEAFVLSKDGNPPPIWERFARKDMYRVGPEVDSSLEIEIALRFREFAGTYVEHCHNTTHEDTAMLMRWDLEYPGQIKLMPSPLPSWDGVTYVTSNAFQSTRAAGPPPGATAATPVIVKDD